MEKTESSGGGLSRRTFLRGTGAAVGALGLAGVAGMTTTQGWLAPAQANAEGEDRIAYTYHQDHCHGHCSLKCTVRDGRLCVIEPNDIWDDKHFRAVCPKGLSEIQHVYSQDRVQTPLRRVGERGAGEFVPITWDEALDELAGKIHEMWDKYGKESVLFEAAQRARTYTFICRRSSAPRARGSAASMRAFSAAWIRCTEAWAQEPRRATGAMRKRCS